MNIIIKAKPKSKRPSIKQTDPTHFEVAVIEPPVDGKANHAIQVALAKYLQVKRSEILLVSGETSREKIFSVPLSPDELQVIYLDNASASS